MNPADVWNTPSFYYATAYWLTVFIISQDKEIRWKEWKKYGIPAGFLCFFELFMYVTNGADDLFFILTMLTVALAIFLFLYIYYEMAWLETGYYCAKVFIVAEFMASFCWQIIYHFSNRAGTLPGTVRQIFEMLLIYAVLYLAWYGIRRTLFREPVDLRITWKELCISLVLALSIYIVSNLSYVRGEWLFSSRLARDIFIIRTLVDFCGVLMLYSYHFQIREVQLRLEKDTLQSIMDMQYKTYQLSQESINIVNQKYHDLKHQIVLLRSQQFSEKTNEYLEQMEEEIRIYEAQNKTGNQVLDVVLTSKGVHCQKTGIELKYIADGKLLNFMDDMDISALFGNMLDNAIESVERIPDLQKRLVRLYVTGEKQFLMIRMENYCEEKLRFRNGMPITNKRDKHLHGFGMKSMQKTVEKYHGSVTASLEDNWFRLRILVPMEQASR